MKRALLFFVFLTACIANTNQCMLDERDEIRIDEPVDDELAQLGKVLKDALGCASYFFVGLRECLCSEPGEDWGGYNKPPSELRLQRLAHLRQQHLVAPLPRRPRTFKTREA